MFEVYMNDEGIISKEEWDAIIDGVTSDDGRTMLRTKESYIINYFSQLRIR